LLIMNPPAKLVAFLTLLAAVFGVSYFAGTQSQALLAPVQIHSSEMVAPSDVVEGYTLSAVQRTQKPGKDVPVEFRVTAPGGQVISELDEDTGEHMHLIAFRRDLAGYQHIIAQQGESTSWWALLDLTPGPWHVIVYFQSTALGREIALAADFMTSGGYHPEPLPPVADQVQVKGLTVTRSGELTTSVNSSSAVTVTDHGVPVTDLQPAHGANGHAVVIRPDDLGYLHMHPSSQDGVGSAPGGVGSAPGGVGSAPGGVGSAPGGPRLDFLGGVPAAGSYRLFVDFYRNDKPYVAAFTVQVTR
jgi:hypothetical protein